MPEDQDLEFAKMLFFVDPFLWKDDIALGSVIEKLPYIDDDIPMCFEFDLVEGIREVG